MKELNKIIINFILGKQKNFPKQINFFLNFLSCTFCHYVLEYEESTVSKRAYFKYTEFYLKIKHFLKWMYPKHL